MSRAALCFAVLALMGVASAEEVVGLTIQFDNRGSKVSSTNTASKIIAAIADCVCEVPISSVGYLGTIGQSSLFNHQSVASFSCTGPTKSGKSLLSVCQKNSKDGWFSSSNAKKCIKKYTDTWAIGDSVKVETANCQVQKTAAVKPKNTGH